MPEANVILPIHRLGTSKSKFNVSMKLEENLDNLFQNLNQYQTKLLDDLSEKPLMKYSFCYNRRKSSSLLKEITLYSLPSIKGSQ